MRCTCWTTGMKYPWFSTYCCTWLATVSRWAVVEADSISCDRLSRVLSLVPRSNQFWPPLTLVSTPPTVLKSMKLRDTDSSGYFADVAAKDAKSDRGHN